MSRIAERISKLEAARPPEKPRVVRRHIVDCHPDEREAQIAALKAAEPDAFHIFNIIIDPAENGIGV